MRIGCMQCGKSVSTEVPDDTVVRAWVECPECIESKDPNKFQPVRMVEITTETIADLVYHIGERSGLSPLEYTGVLIASAFAIGQTLSDREKGMLLLASDKSREIFMVKNNIVADKKGTVQ